MSAYFEMIVDADVTIDNAEQVKERVLALFREKGLIAGDANEDCVVARLRVFSRPCVSGTLQAY